MTHPPPRGVRDSHTVSTHTFNPFDPIGRAARRTEAGEVVFEARAAETATDPGGVKHRSTSSSGEINYRRLPYAYPSHRNNVSLSLSLSLSLARALSSRRLAREGGRASGGGGTRPDPYLGASGSGDSTHELSDRKKSLRLRVHGTCPQNELELRHQQRERESSFIDNLLVRIHLIIVMISVDRPCAMGV